MEKQFQIKVLEYVERLKIVGILTLILWGLITVGINMTWNLRAMYGIDHVTDERLGLLYSMLLVYFYLTYCVVDILFVRTNRVLALKESPQKYKLSFMLEGVHIHLPCLEKSIVVPYKDIKYWSLTGSLTDEVVTFSIVSKALHKYKGQVSVYLNASEKSGIQEACKKFAPEIKIKHKKEHLSAFILTLLDVTEGSEEKVEVNQRSKA